MAKPVKRSPGRYPKRVRKPIGRTGMYRQNMVIGGKYVAPPVTFQPYPIRDGGFFPSI